MCGLVGSSDLHKALQLAESMKQRGTQRWSLTAVKMRTLTTCSIYYEDKIEFTYNKGFEIARLLWAGSKEDELFYIIHLKSSTSTASDFHPAHYEDRLLWHNGMMDSAAFAALKKEAGSLHLWDTYFLLTRYIMPNRLDEFEGSFACLYLVEKKGLYAFRNRIAPLFHDENTYSSIPFAGAVKVEPNVVYTIPGHMQEYAFNNQYNPYGV